MRIGTVIGVACGVLAVVFLAVNSQLLYRGAAAWGLSEWDRVSYGIVGASVPWVIAIFPFLLALTWRRGRWLGLGRPTFATLVAITVWLIFVVYNFVGAMGSIAAVRGQVIAERKYAAESIESMKYQRQRLQDELGWVPKRRPAGSVVAELEVAKLKPQWHSTNECQDIRGPTHRRYCTGIEVLKGELAGARKADDLNAKITALTAKIDGREPVAAKADPTAAILTSLFGVDEASTSERLPIATPIILEIGSMTLLYFAFVLLGLNPRELITRGATRAALTGQPGGAGGTPVLSVPPLPQAKPSKATLTRQRELCEDFFRRCVRPAPAGQLTEKVWYQHYVEVCERSDDVPLPLQSFRRFAERYVPSIREVEGTTYYEHILPLIPEKAA